MSLYRAFEVYLNGQRLCVAGVKEDESLTAAVAQPPGEAFLYVGGSTGSQGDHARWVDLKHLNVGDEVTIKLIDTDAIDNPVLVERAKAEEKSDR